jgi:hypothetical protein
MSRSTFDPRSLAEHNASPDLFTVHPERMLTVTLDLHGTNGELHAISCRYIHSVDEATAHHGVAIEVVHDPVSPTPAKAYACHMYKLAVLVLPANALLQVRPYRIP